MRPSDIVRLLCLAAIWGASFLFMRVIAPVLGPIVSADARVLLAGIALLIWMRATHTPLEWRKHARAMVVVGIFNSGLPFALFSYAALTLPAGYSAIMNATTPLMGALIAALWLGDRLTPRKLAGVLCGIGGVALLVRLGPVALTPAVLLASCACLGAALSYGFASAYIKQLRQQVPPPAMATGSQLVAALLLLPLAPFAPPPAMPGMTVILCTLGLALLCTAVAYPLFFRLIRDVGPGKALTVTFLVPVFALTWSALFLGEPVTLRMIAGCAVVLVATWLVVGAPATARARPLTPAEAAPEPR